VKEKNQNIYDKAIAARAFDILRGFLPAGATTNIAWHTNLRQAADKIAILPIIHSLKSEIPPKQ